ncbi:hypothetical protein EGW08_001029 [Elysia chlorotica]|uniref:Uncharacterized protein n=1 Tax=Elysia chlorotica TaxID=188477 RepID=A0A433UBW7_ELYCH|nr:hypothetical protein EGW08_001029 [Elysia chlorotica]
MQLSDVYIEGTLELRNQPINQQTNKQTDKQIFQQTNKQTDTCLDAVFEGVPNKPTDKHTCLDAVLEGLPAVAEQLLQVSAIVVNVQAVRHHLLQLDGGGGVKREVRVKGEGGGTKGDMRCECDDECLPEALEYIPGEGGGSPAPWSSEEEEEEEEVEEEEEDDDDDDDDDERKRCRRGSRRRGRMITRRWTKRGKGLGVWCRRGG